MTASVNVPFDPPAYSQRFSAEWKFWSEFGHPHSWLDSSDGRLALADLAAARAAARAAIDTIDATLRNREMGPAVRGLWRDRRGEFTHFLAACTDPRIGAFRKSLENKINNNERLAWELRQDLFRISAMSGPDVHALPVLRSCRVNAVEKLLGQLRSIVVGGEYSDLAAAEEKVKGYFAEYGAEVGRGNAEYLAAKGDSDKRKQKYITGEDGLTMVNPDYDWHPKGAITPITM